MLDNKGFDVWAEEYDTSVKLSNEDNTYPFAGYNEIIYKIYKNNTRNFDKLFKFKYNI